MSPARTWSYGALAGVGGAGVYDGVVAFAVSETGFVVLDGRSGEVLRTTGNAPADLATDFNRPALGDIDGDGLIELIGSVRADCSWGQAGQLTAFELDGSVLWRAECGNSGNPVLADLEGDGKVEVLAGDAAWEGATGSLVALGGVESDSLQDWEPDSIAMDVDADGRMDIVTAEAIFSSEGAAISTSSGGDGFVSVASFDGDDVLDVVVSGAPRRAAAEGRDAAIARVARRRVAGDDVWTRPLDAGLSGRTAIADIDADGWPDLVLGADRVLWTLSGQDGSVLWAWELPDFTFSQAPALADLDGDGLAEVVVVTRESTEVRCLATGEQLATLPAEADPSWATGSVAVADVDQDGRLDLLVSHTYGDHGTVDLWSSDGWQPGPTRWHQQAYWPGALRATGEVGGPTEQAGWSGDSFLATALPEGGGGAAVVRDTTDPELPAWTAVEAITTHLFTLVQIEPGAFEMGAASDEAGAPEAEAVYAPIYAGVRHAVRLTHPFFSATTEVTQRQFEDLLGYNPSVFLDCSECPVDSVSWSEAAAFADAASDEEGFDRCYTCVGSGPDVSCEPAGTDPYACSGYRLPTDAEWEFMARAGSTEAYFTGGAWPGGDVCAPDLALTDGALLDDYAWFCAQRQLGTHPVGGLAPNRWGLFDILGNVAEWTSDWVDELQTEAVTDPVNTQRGTAAKILRGGSWTSPGFDLRSAARRQYAPTARREFIGFRLVRSNEP